MADKVGETVDKIVINRVLNVDALNAAARLAGIEKSAINQILHRMADVGVGAHIGWILAAQFQPDADETPGRGGLDHFPARDRTGKGDEVITAPIVHFFDRDEDSPFIVTVELSGFGDAGIAEGKATLTTTVSRLPVIEVFAGANQTVEAGSEVELSASFTRPEGVSELAYSWNFGDGSAPVEGDLGDTDAAAQVDAKHTYRNFRPDPYFVTLTITGQTDVGEVEVSGSLFVFVRETIGVAAAELDAGSTVRDAGRTLQSVGVFLAQGGLWLLILSPAWLVGGVIVFVLIRRRKAIRLPRRSTD